MTRSSKIVGEIVRLLKTNNPPAITPALVAKEPGLSLDFPTTPVVSDTCWNCDADFTKLAGTASEVNKSTQRCPICRVPITCIELEENNKEEGGGKTSMATTIEVKDAGNSLDRLIAVGGVVREATTCNPEYREVTLPEGWRIVGEGTNGAWRELRDDLNRKRGSLFLCKNEGVPIIDIATRYLATAVPDDTDGSIGLVIDYDGEVLRKCEGGRREAETWLDGRYPDWRSVTAYWD